MKEVRIEVVEDDERYYGHALITFHNISVPDGPVRLIVERNSTDTPYLGSDGWQAAPVAMGVELVSRSADRIVVRAGPEICDRIPYSQNVRLQVAGADAFGRAFWPEIMQSPKAYTGTIERYKAPPSELPPKPVDLPQPPESPPEPPPIFEPPPIPEVKEIKEETKKFDPPKRRVWVYLLLLLLVGGGGGLAFWQWDWINPGPPVESLSARFERLKQSDTDGDELLALSDEAFQAGDKGISEQSIKLAVERGNVAAKLKQARWYDPRTFAQDRVQAVDANRAARAYFELAIGGNGEARELLTSICQDSRNGGPNYRDFFDSTYCQGSLDL
ncbi:hypothetical protein GOB57_07770 [Sinorhizobium meliloti]|nr:hypothetical protein [Sinorhizobium meliloti]